MRDALDGAQKLLQHIRAVSERAYRGADYDLAHACWLLAHVLLTAGGSEHVLPLLDEAQQRFEAIERDRPSRGAERMASVCIAERGNCLLFLGRLDEAAAAYEEAIRHAEKVGDDRRVAGGKIQLGAVRLKQRYYREALDACEAARERFMRLDELGSVARIWHQTGLVYEQAEQPEAAEDAYRKSLAIEVRLGNIAGQALTLGQLGNLYADVLGRPEEAVAFLRQAADKFVEIGDVAGEGQTRSNLGHTLRQLGRLDEARQEIRRAIEFNGQFDDSALGMSWAVLAGIETDTGNFTAAAEAKRKAIECYLAYRRDGGENQDADGRICLAVTQSLLAGDPVAAAPLLQQFAADPKLPAWLRPFIEALQTIVTGSRDRTLAAAPDLHYTMAAEILFLLDKLEKAGK